MEETKKLLVIGNGFDLTIGARTSYKSFFESDHYEETKKKAFEWINLGEIQMRNGSALSRVNMLDFDFNCWDLLFCMESKFEKGFNEKANWCDIESVIHDSLIDFSVNKISWKHVYELLHGHFYEKTREAGDPPLPKDKIGFEHANIKTKVMYYYLVNQGGMEEGSRNKSVFYEVLLDELKKFECSFGFYIRQETENDDYRYNAQFKAQQLVGTKEGLQIDSFNYSDFSAGKIDIRHINGDCNDPIFGIDLTEEEEREYPEIRCFTKTSRRVRQDSHKMNRDSRWRPIVIDGAVVFGHSLNRMDYDYFNYLFTLLRFNTFDVEKMKSIEFAYKIYDSNKTDEIRNRQADLIYDLLNYYESYVSKTNQHILINLLRFSGKLIITEW